MIVLLGVAVVAAGFLARLNPLLVVVAAALVTGVLGAVAAGAGTSPQALFAALVHTIRLLGHAFNADRYVSVVWLILPVLGLLEQQGLQERARDLIGRVRVATVGRLLIVYFLARQLTAALGLTGMMGQAQTVRPLIAPMAEGAAEKADGPITEESRMRIRAWAAATDNVAVFFGEDIFIAVASILLITATLQGMGIVIQPLQLSVWAIPTAVCAFLVHAARLMALDRRLKREALGREAKAAEGERP
jgi:uncharacterized membrane protein